MNAAGKARVRTAEAQAHQVEAHNIELQAERLRELQKKIAAAELLTANADETAALAAASERVAQEIASHDEARQLLKQGLMPDDEARDAYFRAMGERTRAEELRSEGTLDPDKALELERAVVVAKAREEYFDRARSRSKDHVSRAVGQTNEARSLLCRWDDVEREARGAMMGHETGIAFDARDAAKFSSKAAVGLFFVAGLGLVDEAKSERKRRLEEDRDRKDDGPRRPWRECLADIVCLSMSGQFAPEPVKPKRLAKASHRKEIEALESRRYALQGELTSLASGTTMLPLEQRDKRAAEIRAELKEIVDQLKEARGS